MLTADGQVSGTHAVLEPIGNRWILRDVSSRNGTYVNGQRLRERVPLRAGDQIRIGKSVLAQLRRVRGGAHLRQVQVARQAPHRQPARPARIERAPARDEPAVVPGRGEAGAEVVAHSPGAHDRDPHPDFPDVDDQLTVLVT